MSRANINNINFTYDFGCVKSNIICGIITKVSSIGALIPALIACCNDLVHHRKHHIGSDHLIIIILLITINNMAATTTGTTCMPKCLVIIICCNIVSWQTRLFGGSVRLVVLLNRRSGRYLKHRRFHRCFTCLHSTVSLCDFSPFSLMSTRFWCVSTLCISFTHG